jgi:hypothetical protein
MAGLDTLQTLIARPGLIALLDGEELRAALHASQSAIAWDFPVSVLDRLADIRRGILREQAKRAAAWQALIAAWPPDATEDSPADPLAAEQETAEPPAAERVVLFLKAALALIADSGTDRPNGGGSRVPVHPKPTQPGPGTAVDIQF